MNPTRVLEIASLPFRRDLYECCLLLFEDPRVEEILAEFGFQHRFDRLEIIRQVSAVDICFLLQFHDRTYLTVLRLSIITKGCEMSPSFME